MDEQSQIPNSENFTALLAQPEKAVTSSSLTRELEISNLDQLSQDSKEIFELLGMHSVDFASSIRPISKEYTASNDLVWSVQSVPVITMSKIKLTLVYVPITTAPGFLMYATFSAQLTKNSVYSQHVVYRDSGGITQIFSDRFEIIVHFVDQGVVIPNSKWSITGSIYCSHSTEAFQRQSPNYSLNFFNRVDGGLFTTPGTSVMDCRYYI